MLSAFSDGFKNSFPVTPISPATDPDYYCHAGTYYE
jgi:hypothetical protein